MFLNGLRVLLFPDPSRPTVTVNMTVLVGSRHEGYGEAGMAHLLEHMVFKGTPMHPNIPQALQDRGARFNGTTTADRTNYFETVPASDEHLEFCLRLEADRLVHSSIRQADLDAEFTVVRNAFERSENAPIGVLFKRIAAAAYEANATYTSGVVFPLRDAEPDYAALVIANVIYGGSTLALRLATRVRQQEGLSYRIGTSFSASSFDPQAILTTNAICNPRNIGMVAKAVAEEWVRLRRDGITEDELRQAKHGYLQAQKVARASDAALARMLASLSHVDRTMAYTAEVENTVAALTPEQVNAAMRKHLDPPALVIVTAGDFDVQTAGSLP